MKYHKYLLVQIFLLILFGIDLNVLKAQDAISASGGSALGNEGTVSFTIGQVVCSTHKGTMGSLAEGVQQPYEISIETGIINTSNISLEISAFPNPTDDYLILKIDDFQNYKLSFQLFDIKGQKRFSSIIKSNEITINVSDYPPGTYYIKVINYDIAVKVFKVVKN